MALPKFDAIKMNVSKTSIPDPQSRSVADMAKILNTESQKEEKAVNVKIIPRAKIVFSETNDYSQDNIEKLAHSILHFKLQNIPSGYYDEDRDVYVIENGERRTRAIDMLVETYSSPEVDIESREYQLYQANVKPFEKGYPFNLIERREDDQPLTRLDEVMSQLRLEDANLEARFDSDERAMHIQKRIELLREYNELVGLEEQINIPEDIAGSFDITKRQAFKYTAVATGLIPELQEEFQKKSINLNDASSMAALPEESQRLILSLIQSGEKVDLNETKKIQEEMDRLKKETARMLEEKEAQILALTEEKAEMEESVDTIVKSVQDAREKERAQLRAQLEEEFRKEIPNPEKVTALENQLKDVAEKHSAAVKQLEKSKRNSAEKDVEIAKLKEEMEQLRQGLSAEEVSKRAKAELGYQSTLKALKTAIEEYKLFLVENRDVLDEINAERIKEDMDILTVKIKELR